MNNHCHHLILHHNTNLFISIQNYLTRQFKNRISYDFGLSEEFFIGFDILKKLVFFGCDHTDLDFLFHSLRNKNSVYKFLKLLVKESDSPKDKHGFSLYQNILIDILQARNPFKKLDSRFTTKRLFQSQEFR